MNFSIEMFSVVFEI